MRSPTIRSTPTDTDRRLTRACLAGAAIGFVPYLALLWDFGVRPLRTMTATGVNADFFDIQARALFRGHLDVPPGSLGIEAFVVDGRHYMYFPPLPALLRMPVLLLTDRLDGRLTALSMLLGWLALVAVLTVLVRRVRWRIRGDAPLGRFEAFGTAVLVASITGGSTLVYLASQPWVYHEVYVWSTAFAIGAIANLIAAWDDPRLRRTAVTFAFLLAAMLTRITAGWALSLAAAATGVWLLVARRRSRDWRRPGIALVVAGLATVLVGSAVNWSKFRHPFRFPIGDQVWSQFSFHRRLALLDNGGRLEGPRFIWTTLSAYFRPDGARFVSFFPYVTPPARPPQPVGDVVLDLSVRTASIPAAMPLLLLLAVWGLVVIVRPGGPPGAAALRIPVAGTLLMTGGVLAFSHLAQRYTSEFLPFLAVAGIAGFADVARRMQPTPTAVKRAVLAAVAVLAAYGMIANGATGLMNSRQNWRGDRLAQLISAQARIGELTGAPIGRWVRTVDRLPEHGAADELTIVGDCDALYIATGEDTGAWIPVEFRDRVFRLEVGDDGLHPGSYSLIWFSGHTLRRLHAQINLDGELRLVLVGTPPDSSGRWLTTRPGDVVEVSLVGDTEGTRFVATAEVVGTGDRSIVAAPMTEWNRQFRSVQIVPHRALGDADAAARLGLTVDTDLGPVLELCNRLRG